MTAGNNAITDSDTLDGVADNVVGRGNFTSYYNEDDDAYKVLRYIGDQNYVLDKFAVNTYTGELFNYNLIDRSGKTVISSDFVWDTEDDSFYAYVVTSDEEDEGALIVTET